MIVLLFLFVFCEKKHLKNHFNDKYRFKFSKEQMQLQKYYISVLYVYFRIFMI